MTDPQDQAELRLRAADPAGPSRALPPPRVDRAELLEAIMSTTTEQPAAAATAPHPSRSRWLLAAAAVIAIAAGGTAVALTVGSNPHRHQAAAPAVKTLKLGSSGPGATTCIRFLIDVLREKQVAFDGTATQVSDNDVLLTVNHWYKGGSAEEVRLSNYHPPAIALEGGVNFQVGHRYLVTAADGVVSGCGYTADWSPQLAKTFQQAFGG